AVVWRHILAIYCALFSAGRHAVSRLAHREGEGPIPLRHWRHTHEAGSTGMIEIEEEENLTPQGDLALQITALPRETNGFGDIYGGWLVSQMDLAGTAMASKVAGGRVATVAIDRMAFLVPVAVGAQLSFYTQALEIGRS